MMSAGDKSPCIDAAAVSMMAILIMLLALAYPWSSGVLQDLGSDGSSCVPMLCPPNDDVSNMVCVHMLLCSQYV